MSSLLLESPFVASMLKSLIPMLFKQVAKLPIEAKRGYADLIAATCDAYADGNREEFDLLLSAAGFDDILKEALSNALWTEDQSVG